MRACKPMGNLGVASMPHEQASTPKPDRAHLQAPHAESFPAVPGGSETLTLNLLPREVCVSKFVCAGASCSFDHSGVLAAIFEHDQMSLIHDGNEVLKERAVAHEPGWRALQIDGTLDFGLAGVLHRVLTPLAKAGVGVLVVSSFDTDYILVKREHLFGAIRCLTENHIDVCKGRAHRC